MRIGKLQQLTPEDIGQWMTYIPRHAPHDKGEWESGKLKRYDNAAKRAWIVYSAGGNWSGDHWMDYTAASTRYEDLIKGRHGR